MTPTIQTQIELLQDTKDELRIAIMEKGVTVYSSDLFSTYPTRISQISMTPGDKDSLFSSLIDRSITGSFDIPQETMKIRSGAFAGCLFSSVTIPDSVTAIDPFAFFSCTNLTSVTIPASVETISNGAFEYCSSLTSVTCLSDTPAQLYGNVTTVFPGSYPIYVPSDSVDAYKTAWSTYANRIQAIPQPQQQKFVRIYDPADATSGYYLATDSYAYALDASLVKSTTRSAGLNGSTNTVNLSEYYDYQTDEFLATTDVLPYAFYFDAENGKLSWTDPDTGTTYYLSSNSNRFNWANTTSVPASTVTVVNLSDYGSPEELSFKDGSRYLNGGTTNFTWTGLGNCGIYKLTE